MTIEICKLLYMDTDSFIYELKCNDVYAEMIKTDISRFDTSEYAVDNNYLIPQANEEKMCFLKDEANGKIVTHFVGLRSKMYTNKVQGGKVLKKSKGVKTNVVKNKIGFEDYLACLKEFKQITTSQRCIRSYAHNVFSIEQSKVALSPYDDKRYLIPVSFETLPCGHQDAKE
ncbi:unnamed protein product [Phaedon cochleariae]|uniref:DNA-directed DNA polymerase n=1 Tax=Phaedon cochleariae TaxID=80249 RepID=A0A9N9SIA0_PHACE|nr:unnamed protein product [Phaedon cochleariae]